MGTQLIRRHVKEESIEIPAIPPGFESFAAFPVKKVEESEVASSWSVSASASEPQTANKESGLEYGEDGKMKRCLRRRSCVNYGRIDSSSSGDESESEQNQSSSARLPKGVVRGCEVCANCQKVTARWRPNEARTPDLLEAPVFHPTEEEFEDTLKYIASIRDKAEAYGICRVVPPPSWKPPCPLTEKTIWDSSTFATRIQRVDKLQNRASLRKVFRPNYYKKRKRRRCMKVESDVTGPVETLVPEAGFGFEPGSRFTLKEFQKYADDFITQYFRKNVTTTDAEGNSVIQDPWEPSVENIEGEYWRMVEKPTEEMEVLYGADLETGTFGSGFPKEAYNVAGSDEKYVRSGWNLNNLPRLPGSVLSYESSDVSGVLVPWLYIGMCFSSFCWHVEDHHLYSMNYMHFGAPKMWYGVPGKDAIKLEAAMRKHLPDLFAEQPDLLHKLVTQLSPLILKSEGVPVFRCVQNPGEFIITFPRAYHAGFNCGFNCAEAVNVAPVDWLPQGQTAIELYREQARRTSISHDKLLLGAARDAVKSQWELNLLRKNTPDNLRWKDVCGKDGVLSKALKTRVEMERVRRSFLCNHSQVLKMEATFDATSERECSVCYFDLHLSAACCHYCSPNKYSCLNHANQFCSCAWGAKFFLFRYDINDLSILVEALEGKLSAIYRWAKFDLGLALTSYVSKDSARSSGLNGKSSNNDGSSVTSVGLKEQKGGEGIRGFLASKGVDDTVGSKYPRESIPRDSLHEDELAKSRTGCKKDVLSLTPENVILLSDDEGEDSSTPLAERGKHASSKVNNTVMAETDSTSFCDEEINNRSINSGCNTGTDQGKEDGHGSHRENLSCLGVSSKTTSPAKKSQDLSSIKEPCNFKGENAGGDSQKSPPCIQNNYRQKGPRIAKVVRRINCHVESLESGVVQSGKSWCDNRAIYPKGFRSRAKYIDILDPSDTCYYISEILDVGQDRPLFMVSLEKCPNEVFIHLSATRCWEMVRERVNYEITKQHKLGRSNLPPLQPPGSLDGMEMFGFSSPSILQVLQSMDSHRVCTAYWESRPFHSHPHNEGRNSSLNIHDLPTGSDTIISNLFKKANLEELNVLSSVLSKGDSTSGQHAVTRLLNEEILKCPR